MKTARFADVVKTSGAPQVHQLWVAAEKDPVFSRAVKEHRVVTVHQENVGSKKDSGAVGFHEEPTAQYLVFPRSVQRFADRRIIGINYDLLAPSERGGAVAAAKPDVAKPASAKRASAPTKRPSGRAPKPAAPSNIVAFKESPAPAAEEVSESARPARAGRKAAAARETSPEPAAGLDAKTRSEIRRAMAELKAGKAVAAYERLGRLV